MQCGILRLERKEVEYVMEQLAYIHNLMGTITIEFEVLCDRAWAFGSSNFSWVPCFRL